MPDTNPPVDYDALASAHGGTVASKAVDYDALAQQQGGKTTTADTPPTDPHVEGLIEHIRNWDKSGAAVDDLKHVAIGALKQPGRLVQGITSPIFGGVAALTDKLYGLPPGASSQAMQPANGAERIGGYAADAAELAAGGAADAGIVGSAKGVQTMNQAGRAVTKLGEASQGAIAAARATLLGGDPITATKIGAVAAKYGMAAVKAAMIGSGMKAGWEAWTALTK